MGLSDEVGLKRTILVVDDEPLARLTTADMLRLGGFDVLEAGSGAQALELLADGYHVAAVVTDVRMPVLDGVGLSHAIREAHPQIPVLFVSGDTFDAAELPAGTHYLRKPLNLRQLIACVIQAIGLL